MKLSYKFLLFALKCMFALFVIVDFSQAQAQNLTNEFCIDNYKIQQNEWEGLGLFLDTLYNPSFKPDPIFISVSSRKTNNSIKKLSYRVEKINFNQSENILRIKGKFFGNDLNGRGSEIIIIVGTRLDSSVVYNALHGNDYYPIDTIKCIYLRNINYSYTSSKIVKSIESIDFDFALKVKSDNNLLIFAKDNYYAEIFDLKKLIKK